MPAFLLAALPIGVACAARILAPMDGGLSRANFAGVFYNLLLGASVFLGCAFVFTKLFRGEILERTLHYYLLTPVRRDVLLLGKYAAGLLASWVLFGTATVVSSVVLFGDVSGPSSSDWLSALLLDLGATLIACMAYGTVFLVFGLVFRNPIIPVAALLGWEGLQFLLPPTLQAISIRHYVGALTATPLPVPDGPIAILAVAPTPWAGVLVLLALTAAGLVVGAWRLRRLEIRYTEE